MYFHEWEPVYEAILADFGYDRESDERARDRLGSLIDDAATFDPRELDFSGATVAVAGAGPGLEAAADRARAADRVVAASTAADRLADRGVAVDLVVTDLDKHAAAVVEWTASGTPVAVHAHGDNVPLLAESVPKCDLAHVIPTTQAAPRGPVRNFGGFTDGDRAAFIADHLGAAGLTFPGWDFEAAEGEKAAKLEWAERLLYWLERRRGEQFVILDGRRGSIDATPLPVE